MVTVRKQHLPAANLRYDFEAWLSALGAKRPPSEIEAIRRACTLVQQAPVTENCDPCQPDLQHALAVASTLIDLRLDSESVAAAILYHLVGNSPKTLADIDKSFGKRVVALIEGVRQMELLQSVLASADEHQQAQGQAERLRKMLLAMAEDVRVVLIKLADRLHQMRTLQTLPVEQQRRVTRETMDIFAPLANRLGIWQIKWELEDLAFRYLQPDAYQRIAGSLAERRLDREHYIERLVARLRQELNQAGIDAEVTGRSKHIYGIWRKMQCKQQDFNQVYDVRAVRILVDGVAQCYAALGVVHALWQYLPGEFDDYIATPKGNDYRSIHTAVVGPEGRVVEVQIRTFEMHQQAELGIAAHWRYKEGMPIDASFDRKIAWLRQLLDWKEEVFESGEFLDQFKSEVFQDRVYVLTPKGNVVDLPQGATPLDFAYHIHTEVGHRCRGAKVNGRMVSLTYELRTGEQVEVLTVKKGRPSRDWINPHLCYLKTRKARSKVQHWFRQQDYDRNVGEGRIILERELKRLGFGEVNYDKLAQQFGHKKADDFLAAVGRGDIKSSNIVHAVQQMLGIGDRAATPLSVPMLGKAKRQGFSAIRVQGVGNLLTRLAGCCRPVPGDAIVGYITHGHGITIHRRDCHKALSCVSECPERLVEVDWDSDATGTFPVEVQILAFDRQGLLRDITTVLANDKLNVSAVNTYSNKDTHTASMSLIFEIPDIDTLSRVLARIQQLPNVIEVWRKTH